MVDPAGRRHGRRGTACAVSTPTMTCDWEDAAIVDSIAALPVTDFRDGMKGRAVGRGRYCYGMLGRAPIRSLRPAVPRRTVAVDGSDNCRHTQRSWPVKKRVRPHRFGRGPYRRPHCAKPPKRRQIFNSSKESSHTLAQGRLALACVSTTTVIDRENHGYRQRRVAPTRDRGDGDHLDGFAVSRFGPAE
jgi:hypothetical protein